MSGKKRVELQIYQHETEEIVVHSYPAEKWADILLIKVGVGSRTITQEDINSVTEVIENMDIPYKQIVIVPGDMQLEFYGFEEQGE